MGLQPLLLTLVLVGTLPRSAAGAACNTGTAFSCSQTPGYVCTPTANNNGCPPSQYSATGGYSFVATSGLDFDVSLDHLATGGVLSSYTDLDDSSVWDCAGSSCVASDYADGGACCPGSYARNGTTV